MIGLDVAPVAPQAAVAADLVRVDRVEPELGAAGDERFERGHVRPVGWSAVITVSRSD